MKANGDLPGIQTRGGGKAILGQSGNRWTVALGNASRTAWKCPIGGFLPERLKRVRSIAASRSPGRRRHWGSSIGPRHEKPQSPVSIVQLFAESASEILARLLPPPQKHYAKNVPKREGDRDGPAFRTSRIHLWMGSTNRGGKRGYPESRRVRSSAARTHQKTPKIGGSSLRSTTPYGVFTRLSKSTTRQNSSRSGFPALTFSGSLSGWKA